jgi:integrase
MKMAAVIDLYEEEGCAIQRGKRRGQPMKARTKAYTIARLRHHTVPLLGNKVAAEINPGDIEKFVADVTAGKTASDKKMGPRRRIIVRGGAGAAGKVVRDLSAVFSFALRREIVENNPCETAAVRKTDNQEERFLTIDEIVLLGSALRELEEEGENPKAIKIASLWALTGCRRDEIAALKWTGVDERNELLRLEDSKTGKSIRPLSSAALTLLKSIDREEGAEYVFLADSGEGHFQGTRKI